MTTQQLQNVENWIKNLATCDGKYPFRATGQYSLFKNTRLGSGKDVDDAYYQNNVFDFYGFAGQEMLKIFLSDVADLIPLRVANYLRASLVTKATLFDWSD